MKVKLAAVSNPDFSPDVPQGHIELPVTWVEVRSLEHASQVCRQYIDENELGGGNWVGGEITHDDGSPIARVSYNGRVWSARTGKEVVFGTVAHMDNAFVLKQAFEELLAIQRQRTVR